MQDLVIFDDLKKILEKLRELEKNLRQKYMHMTGHVQYICIYICTSEGYASHILFHPRKFKKEEEKGRGERFGQPWPNMVMERVFMEKIIFSLSLY